MAGDRVGSSYRLIERIGRGGMGDVWRAEGPQGPVAIKVLRSDLADDDLVVARFLQERSILMGLRSPNVVEVFDLVAEGERLAIVMELVDGVDLRAVLRSEGSLPPARAVAIAQRVLRGLAAAHAIGVVHRDVKPENVLVAVREGGADQDDLVKLADFGVARIAESAGATRLTGIVGTPRYLAPELARGARPTPAADVYGVGAVLYEMLFGRPPFDGESPYAVMRAHAEDPVFRPDGVPDDLWAILERMLSKDPGARPAARDAERSLGGLSSDSMSSEPLARLGYLAAEEPTTHDRPRGARGRGQLPEPSIPREQKPTRPRPRRSRVIAALVGVALVGLLTAGAFTICGDDSVATCVPVPNGVLPPVTLPADRIIQAEDDQGGLHAGMYFGGTFLGFGNRGRDGGEEAQQMALAGAIRSASDDYRIPYPEYLALDRRPPDGVVFREWKAREHDTEPRYFFTIGGGAVPVASADALRRAGHDPSRAVLIPRNALDSGRYKIPADGSVFRQTGTTYVIRRGQRVEATTCRGVHPLVVPEAREA